MVGKSQRGALVKVVEDNTTMVLWDFKFKTDKQLLVNLQDILVVDKEQKKSVGIGVAISDDSNSRKKEHEKVKKYQELKEQLGQMWKVELALVEIGTLGVLGAMTLKPKEQLQCIPGTKSEVSVQKRGVLGTAEPSNSPWNMHLEFVTAFTHA